ncbi:MAG: pyruvate, water dikinase regulatory protein [Pseudomonadota bacterium]|nr:pyruvate, water dikinase regulatory protein [Pseudomonadota bacterium]
MKRSVFFISGATGITAEALGKSLLSQFEGIEFERITLPYIDTVQKAQQAAERIKKQAEWDGERPIVIDTILNQEVREVISTSGAYMADVFGAFLRPLEVELNKKSSYTVGKAHSIVNDRHYMDRIAAVHFALDNDDGARTTHYENADIILLGVSRCGKTPTCLYLGLQYGICAANYPLTEEDTEELQLPRELVPYRDKLFGLTIDPERLQAIRHERRANSKYSSPRQCEMEVRGVEALYNKENIPWLDSTHHSIEEMAARIMAEANITTHVKKHLSV